MGNEVRRLYKSRTDRMIDGVCGGVAEFLGLDPTLVRIAWVVLTFLGGSGILLYIVGMILIPKNPALIPVHDQTKARSSSSNHRFWGILLVVVGCFWFLSNLGVWHHWWGFSWDFVLPTVLILAGVAFLFGGRNYLTTRQTSMGPEGSVETEKEQPLKKASLFHRSRTNRKLFGVCGGLGVYFAVDATIVRLLFVLSAFASFGLTILGYLLIAIFVADEPLMSFEQEA